MAYRLIVALSIVLAPSAAAAASAERPLTRPDPSDSADTRYCLRVGPVTGTLVEVVRCWTRDEWAEQGVDLDREWDKEGVGIRR